LKEKHRALLNATEMTAISTLQNVLISSFVPQLTGLWFVCLFPLLSHAVALEYANVFVSHCGLASVQEAMFWGMFLNISFVQVFFCSSFVLFCFSLFFSLFSLFFSVLLMPSHTACLCAYDARLRPTDYRGQG
jgi:hypothetical protein